MSKHITYTDMRKVELGMIKTLCILIHFGIRLRTVFGHATLAYKGTNDDSLVL